MLRYNFRKSLQDISENDEDGRNNIIPTITTAINSLGSSEACNRLKNNSSEVEYAEIMFPASSRSQRGQSPRKLYPERYFDHTEPAVTFVPSPNNQKSDVESIKVFKSENSYGNIREPDEEKNNGKITSTWSPWHRKKSETPLSNSYQTFESVDFEEVCNIDKKEVCTQTTSKYDLLKNVPVRPRKERRDKTESYHSFVAADFFKEKPSQNSSRKNVPDGIGSIHIQINKLKIVHKK